MLTIAHRGASGYEPENTLKAFRCALAMGAGGIELDVHRCKSGELVVIHDDTVDRTTNGKGKVAEMTLSQLRELRIAQDERIPTLEEALAATRNAYCFIEVKHADAAILVAEHIEKQLIKGWPKERLWLISFKHAALKIAHAKHPSIAIGASYEKIEPTSIHTAHDLGASAVVVQHHALQPAHVRTIHALGMKVFCWTVNTPSDIARVKTMGVDGIMSDYPDRVLEA